MSERLKEVAVVGVKEINEYYASLPTPNWDIRFSHGGWPCVVNSNGTPLEPVWIFENNAPPPYGWMDATAIREGE